MGTRRRYCYLQVLTMPMVIFMITVVIRALKDNASRGSRLTGEDTNPKRVTIGA